MIKKGYVLKALVIVLLTSVMISAASAPLLTQETMTRGYMMAIADRYATYRWIASADNIEHNDGSHIHTPDAVTDYTDLDLHPLPDPETPWRDTRHTGWWTIGENIGIPYFWLGSTAIETVDLGLVPLDNGLFFQEKVDLGWSAGDVTTETHPETKDGKTIWIQDFSGPVVGVDCVGFINNVWKLGDRAGTSATWGGSRPIRFEDLRPGDILMRYRNDGKDHVVLFNEFLDYDPANGAPVPDQTKVKVYESSVAYGKVHESVWVIKSAVETTEGKFETHDVTMQRIQVKIGDNFEGIDLENHNLAKTLNKFFPRTNVQPIDVVLVIDRSGSMEDEDKIIQTKEAAKMFIDLMRPGDRIGVVAFSNTADVIFSLTELTDDEFQDIDIKKMAAKVAVESITASGGTSIGAGLQLGQQELNTSENPVQLMVLLSDGEENTSPRWSQVSDEIIDPVYAVGLGAYADHGLLVTIATATDGVYGGINMESGTANGIKYIFNVISANLYNEEILWRANAMVPSGATVEETVLVDSTIGLVTFSLAWPGSDLDLTLVQPDGTIIDPTVAETDPNIEFVSGSTYEFYKIFAPQKGEWTLRIFGKSTSGPEEDYSIFASAADAMILSVDAEGDEHFAGDPIKLTASIEDSFLDSPIEPEYIHGVAVQVTVNDPNNNESSFELYDDGLHGDGDSDDGIYANSFSNIGLEGSYNFNVQFSGNTNRDGQPFTREENLSLVVNNVPTVVSSVRTYANPTSSYSVNYTVTFSEKVTGVDMSDFSLVTGGSLSGAAVTKVTGSGSVYTVTVDTGNGIGTVHLDVLDDDTIVDKGGISLGGTGLGNGEFTTGETYDVDNTTSTTTVNKFADTNDGVCNAADCSLREAVAVAAFGNAVTFDAALSGGTIHLASTLTLSKNVTIDSSMLDIPITISGDTNDNGTADVQALKVNSGVVVSLNSLTIKKSFGFGIQNFGTLMTVNSALTGNGGGIRNNGGILTVLNSTVSENGANYGGGIRNDVGTVTIVNSTFSSNISGQEGGGIYNDDGTLTITNSTFSGNRTWYQGGGISNQGGTLTIINSTFSGNYATYSATSAGGLSNLGGTFNLINTIIANSVSSKDCSATNGLISTNTNNLVEDGSCSALLSGDPNLGALADNGGSTQTMALLAGSPAIDAGDATTCANAPVNNLDQRGITRLQGVACDIGAYESNAEFLATPTPTPSLTPTLTFTATATPTFTSTFAPTSTATPTFTPTATPTFTPTAISTPTPTATATPTDTMTPTVTPTTTPTYTSAPNSCTPSNSYGQSQSGYHFASFKPTSSLTDFNQLPLSFVPNLGQENASVRFQTQGLGGKLFFAPGEVVFSLPNPVKVPPQNNDDKEKIRYDLHPANVVRIHYQGANNNPEVVGLGELTGVVNVLKGNDPSKWRTNLPTYSGIAYRELYSGIELRYEGTDGKLKSTFNVAPGADPSAIVWRYKGASGVNIDASGNLVVSLPQPAGNGAVLIERAPIAWQEVNGNRVMVAVQYALDKKDKKVSFRLPNGYDSTLPLVIDPELTYSAYLGGGQNDEGNAITLDADCNVYLTGSTYSTDFPTANPLQTNLPGRDVFVSKLNLAGDTLLYSTYIGGNQSDNAWGIALDSAGRITIVGETESSNFPTLNAYDNTQGGGTCDGEPCDDVFVTQLLADGSALRYSTYMGGNSDDEAAGIALGPNDMLYLAGWTKSSAFPRVNAHDTSFGGGTCSGVPCPDGFVAKVDPSLSGVNSLLYSTYLGGNNYDKSYDIAVDSNGRVYVTGYTSSNNFPMLNAYQPARASAADVFVSKFDTALSGTASLLYSTYLGGGSADQGTGIALNGADQVYLTGFTSSANFPLANAIDNTLAGTDAFITHLNIASNNLAYSTYLGGSNEDRGQDITVDDLGNAYITGYTKSTNFPILSAIQPAKGVDTCSSPPCADAFVTKVNPAGNALIYSTYLGGGSEDYGNAIVVDGLGGTYIIGYTFSIDFPATLDLSIGSNSYSDAFVVKIDD